MTTEQIVFTTIPCGTIGGGPEVGLYEVLVRGRGIGAKDHRGIPMGEWVMTVEAKGRKGKRVLSPCWSHCMGQPYTKLAQAFDALKLPEGHCGHTIVRVDVAS